MAKKKKEVEVKEESKIEDRKSIIQEHFLKVTDQWKPKIIGDISFQESFDMRKVIDLPEVRGLLKQSLPNFKMQDKKTFLEILQDLKKAGVLLHKAAHFWVRLK